MDGRNRRIGVPHRLGAAALVTLLLATAVAAGADAQSRGLQTTVTVPLGQQAPSVTVNVRLPAAPVEPPEVTPPPAPAVPVPVAPSKPLEPSALLPPSARPLPPPAVPEAPVQRPSLSGLPDPNADARSGTSNSQSSAPSNHTPVSPAGETRSSERAPSARSSSVKPRRLLRPAVEAALHGRPLRQLRQTVLRHRGCLPTLSDRQRLALELRAGLFGRDPAPQQVIARRIGISPTGVQRLQRTALRGLISAGEDGRCGGGPAAATATAAPASGWDAPSATSAPAVPDETDRSGNPEEPAGAVLADVHEGGPGVDLDDGTEGPTESLLFLLLALLALLGPLAAIAFALQRRDSQAPPAIADGHQRPLLFLDVDGVLVLDPRSDILPPGRLRPSPLGLSYVPHRTRDLVRKLATRFDIVWTTGWEQHANTTLSGMLGLSEELPVLEFGKRARAGSSSWKIKPVDEYAGDRPIAWLDDNFAAKHERWAAHRARPTLLVRVDARAGLSPGHVERLLDWADRLGQPRGTSAGRASKQSIRVP